MEEAVAAVRAVGQGGHPAKLPVEKVQDGGGVEHLLLKPPQEGVVPLSETLGQRQGVLQLLLQGAFQRLLPRAVCKVTSSVKSSKIQPMG